MSKGLRLCALSISLNLIFFMGLYPLPAYAAESLRFKTPSTYKHRLAIEHITAQKNQTDVSYQIAEIDLNNDFINEYVIKLLDCKENELCLYHIIAIADLVPIDLGSVNSSKVIIDYSDLYGVRNIKSYNNPDNNFRYTTLKWSPFSFQYEVSKPK